MRAFIDTNTIWAVLLHRADFLTAAANVWDSSHKKTSPLFF